MPDALDSLLNSPTGEVRTRAPSAASFIENCAKCAGSGSWRGRGKCFACNGTGHKTFRTSPETRGAARSATGRRLAVAAGDIATMAAAFKTANPDVMAWIAASPSFPFAVSIGEAIDKYGDLTENQLVACLKCVRSRADAATARTERETNAPEISITRIEEAFEAAREVGLRWPKLNLATFKFKPAKATGSHAGSIYVTEMDEYLGRVTDGKFICTRACTPEQQAKILEACADPEAAAIAYGMRTGSCACCGRELTAGVSLDRGIGPICATKYGW